MKGGLITPSDEIKSKMCEIFDCSLDYLMGENNFRTQEDALNEYLKQQDRLIIAKTIQRYSEDFISIGINHTNINEIIDLLCLDRKTTTTDEQIVRIKNYLDNFNKSSRKQLKRLFIKILEELAASETNMNFFHYLMSSIERENKARTKTNDTSRFYMCPVYGKINAGMPNWIEENLDGYLPIDPNLMNIINPEECFFLKVNGESMNRVVSNGSYALIRKQDIVSNGEIAIVLINGDEATLKKFTKQDDLIILEPMSYDSSFTVQVYDKHTSIKILGKYIGKFEINN